MHRVLDEKIARRSRLTPSGRSHLSYSEIACFRSCPLKWHYTYVQKLPPEQISAALLLGGAIHAAIQTFYQALLSADSTPGVDDLLNVFRDAWATAAGTTPVTFGKAEHFASCEAQARCIIEAFLTSDVARIDRSSVLGIEEAFRVPLSPKLPELVGRADLVTRHDGQLLVTDFKTARSAPGDQATEDQGEQLVLYAKGCESIAHGLGLNTKLRFVFLTKTKQPRIESVDVKFDADRLDRTTAVVLQVYRAMESGAVYPSPSPMNCHGCGFRRNCNHWHKMPTHT